METIGKIAVEITIAGKNITGDVSPYLAKITYTDRVEDESDDISLTFEDTAARWQKAWYPQQGDSLEVRLGVAGNTLDCGLFEIDQIEFEFPPDALHVKALGAAISKSLRTKNSKAFEKQSLKKIAQYFADKHGLKLTGNMGDLAKIQIERKTQDRETDISFLAKLAKEYGLIFSVRGQQLVFMTVDELEKKPAVMTIGKDRMSKARFQDKTSQVYAAATVATRDVRSNTVKKWQIKPSGDPAQKDTLIVGGRVENDGQAQAKAKGALKAKNKDKTTGTITLPGDCRLVAGVNVELTGVGEFSGKWHIAQSTHTVDPASGYTTDISVRKIVQS